MVSISVQETPNPAARRFLLDVPVQEESRGRFFKEGDDVDDPLVEELLRVFGVEAVMLLPNSVTVNKVEDASWEKLEPTVREAIERWDERRGS
ncbi:MAG: NifU N-terminal domain-containing protein [Actinobacteria bacterium]|nr:NifU N-terminal domain-containing protein [Actinomycetota bacterium]